MDHRSGGTLSAPNNKMYIIHIPAVPSVMDHVTKTHCHRITILSYTGAIDRNTYVYMYTLATFICASLLC